MILRPAQIYLLRMGRPATPANFGGDSDSDSSTQTTNQTTNYATSTDKRNVASDAAVALSGDNNTVDRSSVSNTSFSDSSNRSTNFSDSSNRSVTYTSTSTDYGSVGKSLDALGGVSLKSLDVASGGVTGAIEALKYIADQNQKSVALAFDMSKSASANALSNSASVMGFANSALEKTSAAMENAKDGGQSKMVNYAIAAVAVVGVAFALKS